MQFATLDPLPRAALFGGIFLVSLFAVLWLWYDSSGRTDGRRWGWRLLATALVLGTIPAVVLGAANLDVDQHDLFTSFGWAAIGCGSVAVLTVLAYAVWGRTERSSPVEPADDVPDFEEASMPDRMLFPGAMPAAPGVDNALTVAQDATIAGTDSRGRPARVASGAATAYMFAKAGPDQGRQYPLSDLVTIGRGSACGIALTDPRISTSHAQLKLENGNHTFIDLNSTNGSFLVVEGREERIRGPQVLVDGDEVRMGSTVLKFIAVPAGDRR